MNNKYLKVFFYDRLVGYLAEENQEMVFQYDSDYLSDHDSLAISINLAKREEKYHGKAVEAFFAGFLPEAEIRTLIANKFGLSEDNSFSLLNKLGGECAGAISVGTSSKKKTRELLSQAKLEKYFRQIPDKALLSLQGERRLSLAGAQHKLVVLKEGDKIYFPANDEFSTHILKPAIKGFEHSAENEFFCLKLAKEFGIKVADVEIFSADEVSYLLVKRYDRQDGSRLHQEDFSQALGILPKYKYEQEGGPGYKECFDLLRKHSSRTAVDTLMLLDLVIFNFLIANNDAHAKNFSFLYRDMGLSIELAPAYDLMSTAIYPELSPNMAMKLGKDYKYKKVRPSDWECFAEEIGINKKYLGKKLNDISDKLLVLAQDLSAEVNKEYPSKIYNQIIGMIKERTKYCFI